MEHKDILFICVVTFKIIYFKVIVVIYLNNFSTCLLYKYTFRNKGKRFIGVLDSERSEKAICFTMRFSLRIFSYG